MFLSLIVPTSPPRYVKLVPTDSETLYIQWIPPPLDGQNGNIVYYLVNISVSETGNVFELSPENSTVSVTSLHPFYTYRVVVAAVTMVGVGPFSEGSTIHMPEDGK